MSDLKTNDLIREYLLDEGILRKRIKDSKLDFGFQFIFTTGQGKHIMAAFKPRAKDLVIISSGIQIAEQHIKALDSLENDKKMHFFMELRKFFLFKDVFFRIDVQNHRYEISDQIFLKKNGHVSKNSFFKSVRKVFNCAAYSNLLLAQYCSGKIFDEDFYKSKDFSNFSLYS